MSSKKGFGALDPAERSALSSRGGKAAHERGTAHEFTSEEARAAGTLGGKAVSKDREYMAEIGRRGGHARARKRRVKGG